MIKASLILLLICLTIEQKQQIKVTTDYGNIVILDGPMKNSSYQYFNQCKYYCQIPDVLQLQMEQDTFEFNVYPSQNITVNISSFSNHTLSTYTNTKGKYQINMQCQNLNQENKKFHHVIFDVITVKVNNNQFEFIKICTHLQSYQNNNFNRNCIALTIGCFLISLFFSRLSKITVFSQRIQVFELNLKNSLIMITIWIIIAASIFYINSIQVFYQILMVFLTLFCLFFNLTEDLLYFKQKLFNYSFKILKYKIRFFDFFVFSLAVGIAVSWFCTFNLVLSNICAFIIAITGFKLFKLKLQIYINRSLRDSLRFLILICLVETLFVFILGHGLNTSSDVFLSSQVNLPIKFVTETSELYLDKKCSWISITDVIFSGVFLSYFHRIDKALGINTYFFVGAFAQACGLTIWISVEYNYRFRYLTIALCTYPLITLFIQLTALYRNELSEVWYGNFKDIQLQQAQILADGNTTDAQYIDNLIPKIKVFLLDYDKDIENNKNYQNQSLININKDEQELEIQKLDQKDKSINKSSSELNIDDQIDIQKELKIPEEISINLTQNQNRKQSQDDPQII